MTPRGELSEAEFRTLLQAGHGRAMVCAQEGDVSRFRDVILDACLHCYSIDPQVEGTRAHYMHEFVKWTREPEFYGDRVLDSLREGGDDWNTTQRFRYATAMALEGEERARRAVFDHFDPGPRQGEWIALDLVELEGWSGFLVAAAKMGALLRRGTEGVDVGWLWSRVVSDFGEEEATRRLREAAAADGDVAGYLAAVENPSEGKRSSLFEQRRLAKNAGVEELEGAARKLLQADGVEEQIRSLYPFRFRTFPLDPSRLFELATSVEENLADAACAALSLVEHPAVREFALQLAVSGRTDRAWATAMLDRNFAPGDHERVLEWFGAEADRDVRHELGRELLAFWANHPAPDAELRMLQMMYEGAPCAHCRETVVRRLLELAAHSPAMRRECAHDANEEIREMVLPLR